MQSKISDSFDVTTLLGSELGLTALLPVNLTHRRETTLNNLLNVFPNEPFAEMPKLRYFGVGMRGAYNADDEILSSAYNPKRENMNLYRLIPLRCVPVDEDLSDEERALFRLRQRRIIGDQECFLYYLGLLQIDDKVRFKKINPLTGKEEPYEPNPEFLSPIPEKPLTNTTIESTKSSIVAYCEAKVNVDAKHILEYIRREYDGDTRYGRVSEIGFFTGVDKQVTSADGNNVPISYMESIYTMLYNHSTWTGTPLTHEGMSINSTFEITSQGSISEK